MNTDIRVDCLIIGGGPAGLTAAIYLSRYLRDVIVADDGASRASLIPKTHNYPGFPAGITGPHLLSELRQQARLYGATFEQGFIERLEVIDGGLQARLGNRYITARKVLLATGIVDEKPALPHLREFIYAGAVRFCPICDGYEAIDKRIAVIGKLENALKKALFLRTYTRDVTLLVLDDPLRLSAAQRRALQAAGIAEPPAPVVDLVANGDVIEADLANGTRVLADILYPAMGADVHSNLATGLGAKANPAGCLIVDDKQRTSVPNLYAAGDVTLELHQLAVAIGQAAIAATDMHNSLPANYR
jgi:thioredoxin reductase (NADPH)